MSAVEPLDEHPWRWQHYQRHGPIITTEIRGLPIPQGSKSVKGRTKTGRVILAESSTALKPWRELVQHAFEDAIRDATDRWPALTGPMPIDGPVAVDLTFTMRKPKSAPKRRRTFPTSRPDLDKLERAVLDAGTAAGLWRDDSQVIDMHSRKVFPLEAPQSLVVPGVYVFVYRIGDGS